MEETRGGSEMSRLRQRVFKTGQFYYSRPGLLKFAKKKNTKKRRKKTNVVYQSIKGISVDFSASKCQLQTRL